MQYISFSVWLILLNIMPSRFIHLVSNARFPSFYDWIICIWFLYPATLLNLLVQFCFFFWWYLWTFLCIRSCPLETETILLLSSWFESLYFSCLIAVVWISNTVLNRSVKSEYPSFAHHFREKNIQPFIRNSLPDILMYYPENISDKYH